MSGSAAQLTREQKQFNKLIARIEATRQELAHWREFVPVFQQRYAAEVEPLTARLREQRIAMVMLLDQAMGGKALNKRERAKVVDIMTTELWQLLAESRDAELVRLYNKYSDVKFEDEQRDEMDFMQVLARETFGVDLKADDRAGTPEELARRIHEKLQASRTGRKASREARRKSAKAIAQEALREQTKLGASKAVREIYRKLASELHPDREPDPDERARKTALMQKVNQAYNAHDLLVLLELQLSIEQIDPAALANMAKERVVHYNHVLEEQWQRLREELSEITMPFAMTVGDQVLGQLTPDSVRQALDAEISEIRVALRKLESDLKAYEDISTLKRSVKHYHVGRADDDDLAMLEELLFGGLKRRRR